MPIRASAIRALCSFSPYWRCSVFYLLPPLALLGWPLHGSSTVAALGLAGWLCMTLAYWPIVRLHCLRPYWALTLPVAAVFYTAMTINSALQVSAREGWSMEGPLRSARGAAIVA